ncbi:unnamed protein product, partial [Owenia fusiformis]
FIIPLPTNKENMFLFKCIILIFNVFYLAESHSWVNCVDYLEKNGEDYEHDLCRAYPREGERYVPKTGQFGRDTGYDSRPGTTGNACEFPRDDTKYTAAHPMAVYYPGQQFVITHPTKNHVADVRCTSKYIPDNGNELYIGPKDAQGTPTLAEFLNNPLADLGISPFGNNVPNAVTTTYPKEGFQNAPKFCENPDKALATNNVTLPDLEPGRYAILWIWRFNGNQDMYTTCWDADVVATKAERDAIYTQRALSTKPLIDVALGGKEVSDSADVVTTTTTTSANPQPEGGGTNSGGNTDLDSGSPNTNDANQTGNGATTAHHAFTCISFIIMLALVLTI